MPQWIIALLSALVGATVGAFATGAVQYLFWKRQHSQEVRAVEERETHKERARATERLREIGVLLLELAHTPVDGANIEKTQAATTTYLEVLRLQRELVNAATAAREVFPDLDRDLTVFQRMVTQRILRDPSEETIKMLQAELEALLAKLRKP
jgi:hypothetical protein